MLLIIFFVNPAFGFKGMTSNNTTAQTNNATQNLGNFTQSDRDIVLIIHLIEIDTVQLKSENKLLVRETLVFKNTGTENFFGQLRTWVPDGTEKISISRNYMMNGTFQYALTPSLNENILSWQDSIEANTPLSPLYTLEYAVAAESGGAKHFSKMLASTWINKQSNNILLKVTTNEGESITVTDENGNSISGSGSSKVEGNSTMYAWEAPVFKELNIEISKPAVSPATIAGYVIIGAVILLVLLYPVLRKRSGKLQSIEEKLRNSLKREHRETGEEEIEESTEAIVSSEIPEEVGEEPVVEEDDEFQKMTKDELEIKKTELISKLSKLDNDYASGDLLDEDYEEQRESYQKQVKKIKRKIEKLG
ncbi:MAG TPA: hypothetical protein VIO58_13685 [Candidatus Methanoperedens sp.]